MKILQLLFCGLAHAEDYKNHYIAQPLRALFGHKMPDFPESNWIERNNQAWIDRNDEAKEKVSFQTFFILSRNHFRSKVIF